jgi:hypothetical protein
VISAEDITSRASVEDEMTEFVSNAEPTTVCRKQRVDLDYEIAVSVD